MEHRIAEPSPPAVPAKDGPQVSWRDLREWIALLERNQPDAARSVKSPDHSVPIHEVHDARDDMGLRRQYHGSVRNVRSGSGGEMRLRPRVSIKAGDGDGAVRQVLPRRLEHRVKGCGGWRWAGRL